MQASALIEKIRGDLRGVDGRLLRHPYLESLEQGRFEREKLRLFAGEQYAIITSDLRSVAHLLTRFGASPSREFLFGVLQGERAALEALLVFGRALGMDENELRRHDPAPGAHAYTAYMAWLALYGSDAQTAAAYLVNFPTWGRNCGRMSRALMGVFNMKDAEVAFFNLFASPPATFESQSLAVIQRGLDGGEDPNVMGRVARLLQAYELMFWDSLYEASRAA